MNFLNFSTTRSTQHWKCVSNLNCVRVLGNVRCNWQINFQVQVSTVLLFFRIFILHLKVSYMSVKYSLAFVSRV